MEFPHRQQVLKVIDVLANDYLQGKVRGLAIEGRGPAGSGGWYESGAPYRSEMILVFTEDEKAKAILAGVQACSAVQDPKHPIRAFQLGVEGVAACGCQRPAPTTER